MSSQMDLARAALQRLKIARDARSMGLDPVRLAALIGADEAMPDLAVVDEVVVAAVAAEEIAHASDR